MRTMRINEISRIAMVTSLYVILTLLVSPLSFGSIQFRFSEILVLLCFYDKKYASSIIIGCFISNLFTPGMLILDLVFGTLHTIVSSFCVSKCKKNLALAAIFPALFSFIVAIGISLSYELPYFISVFQVMIGEVVVVVGIGYPLFKTIEKNKPLMNVLKIEKVSEYSTLSGLDYFSIVLISFLLIVSFSLDYSTVSSLFSYILDFPFIFLFYVLNLVHLLLIVLKKKVYILRIILCLLILVLLIYLSIILMNISLNGFIYYLLVILLIVCNLLSINNR